MENVFGGVRIMPEDEPRISRMPGRDPRGQAVAHRRDHVGVQVRLADGPDDEDDDRSFRIGARHVADSGRPRAPKEALRFPVRQRPDPSRYFFSPGLLNDRSTMSLTSVETG